MATTDFISPWDKIDAAKRDILTEFSNAVTAVVVMGSITREATDASDLDVSVVFRDEEFNKNVEHFRQRLSAIAAKINARFAKNELVLWASKADHYRTLLPDISYVRRNLPYSLDRLDAWCGLAKNTLALYEGASSRVVYGALDLTPKTRKIPRSEALELFLIATRCMAEGLSELSIADAGRQRNGANHLAKASLRAAYAAIIAANGRPCNSYREILEAAIEELPGEHQSILCHPYDLKLGLAIRASDIADALRLMRYCEERVSAVKRLKFSGITWGRAGESFAYSDDAFDESSASTEKYSRFAGYDANFVHSLYFVLTAQEIVKRLPQLQARTPEVLDFFFEEIVTVATVAFFNPAGINIHLGIHESTELPLKLGVHTLKAVVPLLSGLATLYLNAGPMDYGTRWLDINLRIEIIRALASQLSEGPRLGNDDTRLSALRNDLDVRALCRATQWQSHLLRGLYSEQLLEQLNKLTLIMYQAGLIDDAEALVKDAMQIDRLRKDLEARILDPDRKTRLRSLLSQTHQYYGVVLQRKEQLAEAEREYACALELNPDNFSALDDFASLLMKIAPTAATAEVLTAMVGKATAKRAEARRQIIGRFMKHAIALKQAGEYEEARFWYERTINLDPTDATSRHNFALLLEAMNEIDHAKVQYERAIELDPKYTKAYIGLGRLFENSSNDRNAMGVLQRAIDAEAGDERIWTNLGNLQWKNHDLAGARGSYQAAIGLMPDFADAWNGLGVLLISVHNPSAQEITQALAYFERSIEADPAFEGAKANYMRALSMLLSHKMG
jgi:tetratricopeptide (TPR) repeat protein